MPLSGNNGSSGHGIRGQEPCVTAEGQGENNAPYSVRSIDLQYIDFVAYPWIGP